MRKVYALTVLLVALSFSAQAEEPKAAPETKKATVVIPKSTVRIVGAKIVKTEPKKTEPVKAVEPAPASQPVKAEPTPIVPKVEPAPVPAPVVVPQQKWWQEGLTELIKLIGAILLVLISAFVTVLMKKYGFQANQQVLDDVLHRAVSYVEQTTTSKLNEGAEKTPGAKKMEIAVEIAKKLAAEAKLKEKGTEWWTARLESWLGATSASKNGTVPTPTSAPSPEKPA